MNFYYKATEKFSPDTRRVWQGYDLNWDGYMGCSRIKHLTEVVTLDGILGESIVKADPQIDADYKVWGEEVYDLFNNLDYLLFKLKAKDFATFNLLAVAKEPTSACEDKIIEGFKFIGYDLMDVEGGVSTLTNCGGYFFISQPEDVNNFGLIPSYERAFEIRGELKKNYADEHHTDCSVWAIWRMK